MQDESANERSTVEWMTSVRLALSNQPARQWFAEQIHEGFSFLDDYVTMVEAGSQVNHNFDVVKTPSRRRKAAAQAEERAAAITLNPRSFNSESHTNLLNKENVAPAQQPSLPTAAKSIHTMAHSSRRDRMPSDEDNRPTQPSLPSPPLSQTAEPTQSLNLLSSHPSHMTTVNTQRPAIFIVRRQNDSQAIQPALVEPSSAPVGPIRSQSLTDLSMIAETASDHEARSSPRTHTNDEFTPVPQPVAASAVDIHDPQNVVLDSNSSRPASIGSGTTMPEPTGSATRTTSSSSAPQDAPFQSAPSIQPLAVPEHSAPVQVQPVAAAILPAPLPLGTTPTTKLLPGGKRTSWLQRGRDHAALNGGNRVSNARAGPSLFNTADLFAPTTHAAPPKPTFLASGSKRKSEDMTTLAQSATNGPRNAKMPRLEDRASVPAESIPEPPQPMDDDGFSSHDSDDDANLEATEDYVHTFKKALAGARTGRSMGGPAAAELDAKARQEREAALAREEERQREEERLQEEARQEHERLAEQKRKEERARLEDEQVRQQAEAAAVAERERLRKEAELKTRLAADAQQERQKKEAEKKRIMEDKLEQERQAEIRQREAERVEQERQEKERREESRRHEEEQERLREAERHERRTREEADRVRRREELRAKHEAETQRLEQERLKQQRLEDERLEREHLELQCRERERLAEEERVRQEEAQLRLEEEEREQARRAEVKRHRERREQEEAEQQHQQELLEEQERLRQEDQLRASQQSLKPDISSRLSVSDLSLSSQERPRTGTGGTTTPPDSPPKAKTGNFTSNGPVFKPAKKPAGIFTSGKPVFTARPRAGDTSVGSVGGTFKDVFTRTGSSSIFTKPTQSQHFAHATSTTNSAATKRAPVSVQSTTASLASDAVFDHDGSQPAWVPQTQDTELDNASQPKRNAQLDVGDAAEQVEQPSWMVGDDIDNSQAWKMLGFSSSNPEDSLNGDTWSTSSRKIALIRPDNEPDTTEGLEPPHASTEDQPAPEPVTAEDDILAGGDRNGSLEMDIDEDEVLNGSSSSRQATVESVESSQEAKPVAGSSNFIVDTAARLFGGVFTAKKPAKSSQLAAAAVAKKKEEEEKEKKATRLRNAETRRILAQQKKADEEKARTEDEQKRLKEDLERRKREREDTTADKRAVKLPVKKGGDEDTKKRKLAPDAEKKSVLKKPASKDPVAPPARSIAKPKPGHMKQPSIQKLPVAGPSGSQPAAAGASTTKSTHAKAPSVDKQPALAAVRTPKPALTVPQPPRERSENIELPDIASEYSDSDDEERNAKKAAQPSWVQSPDVRNALIQQGSFNPDEIFGGVQELRMEEIFRGRTSRFRARTSSANWTGTDRLTTEEEVAYAERMGYN